MEEVSAEDLFDDQSDSSSDTSSTNGTGEAGTNAVESLLPLFC